MYRGLSSILNFFFGRLPKRLVHFYWYQSMLSDIRGFYLKCMCIVYYLLSLCCLLVLVQHLVEGVVKLAGDRVDLQLLPDDLVLQLVDPKVELGDVHLSVFGAGIGLLSLMFSCLIWSWYFSSLLLAFSSEISSCFW